MLVILLKCSDFVQTAQSTLGLQIRTQGRVGSVVAVEQTTLQFIQIDLRVDQLSFNFDF